MNGLSTKNKLIVAHITREQLREQLSTNKFICIGGGNQFLSFYKGYSECVINLLGVYDNFKQNVELGGELIKVESLPAIRQIAQKERPIVLITNAKFYKELVDQFSEYPEFGGLTCYIEHIINRSFGQQNFVIKTGQELIPKKIHYCWFGRKEIPNHLQCYIDSWKKFCPDYEIIKWTEDNYDVKKIPFMEKAYSENKLAFVPDYARLDIIYQNGGFYLDTDVELIKTLDSLRSYRMIVGFDGPDSIGMGIGFGAMAGNGVLREVMNVYENMEFDSSNLVSSNFVLTEFFKEKKVEINNTYQEKKEFCVLPSEVFCPNGYNGMGCGITDKTVSIHHNEGSWIDNYADLKEKIAIENKEYIHWIENMYKDSKTQQG